MNKDKEKYYKFCDCSKCERNCVHKNAFRRLPKEIGGLGLCEKLRLKTRETEAIKG